MNRKSASRGLVPYMRKNGWIVRIWASTLLVGRNAFFLIHSSRGEYGTADICPLMTEGRSVENIFQNSSIEEHHRNDAQEGNTGPMAKVGGIVHT